MFLKLSFFVCFCFLFNVLRANGENKNITTYHDSSIVREYLLVEDEVNITISNLKVAEDTEMAINVVIDKTLGYNIDPFYPFYRLRDVQQQPQNMNASEIIDHYFDLEPSTFVFEIDFKTNNTSHLHLKPKDWLASSMVHLYPDEHSMKMHNTSLRNQVKLLSQCNVDGEIFYNLNFFLVIESAKSEGLHTLSLHSRKEISTEIKVEMSGHNISVMYYKVQLGAYIISTVLAVITCFRRHGGTDEQFFYLSSIYFISLYKLLLTGQLLYKTSSPDNDFPGSLGNMVIFFFVLNCIQWLMVLCSKDDEYMIPAASTSITIYSHARFFEFTNTHPFFFWLSKFTLVAHFVLFMVFVANTERKYQAKRRETGNEDGSKFVTTRLCLISVIVLIVLSFHLVPASMIWLRLPFYLFWMQVAIEELLYMTFWWFVFLPYWYAALTNANIMKAETTSLTEASEHVTSIHIDG